MPDIILHPSTEKAVTLFLARPAHAMLLVGQTGSGKMHVARYIAAGLFATDEGKLEKHAYMRIITPEDGKAISIDSIRELQQFMTLKIPTMARKASDGAAITRIAIIENAHLLTSEAQNAMLKTLEEPPENTVILMTANSAESLLPTILSRVRTTPVVVPTVDDLAHYFTSLGFSPDSIQKATMISGCLPGLTQALLTDPSGHVLYEATEMARTVLRATVYERLALVDTLSKQRQLAIDMLFILGQMSRMTLQKADKVPASTQSRWQTILKQSYRTGQLLRGNAQAKLVMTDLMLNL